MSEYKNLITQVPKEFGDEFKKSCKERNLTMSVVLRKLAERFVKDKKLTL